MTTTFDKREEGFENQFAHDEAVKFRATARRNSLVGLWAADKLGLVGAEAQAYARALVISGVDGTEELDVFGRIRRDFDAKGIRLSDHQIRRTMEQLMAIAMADIKKS